MNYQILRCALKWGSRSILLLGFNANWITHFLYLSLPLSLENLQSPSPTQFLSRTSTNASPISLSSTFSCSPLEEQHVYTPAAGLPAPLPLLLSACTFNLSLLSPSTFSHPQAGDVSSFRSRLPCWLLTVPPKPQGAAKASQISSSFLQYLLPSATSPSPNENFPFLRLKRKSHTLVLCLLLAHLISQCGGTFSAPRREKTPLKDDDLLGFFKSLLGEISNMYQVNRRCSLSLPFFWDPSQGSACCGSKFK